MTWCDVLWVAAVVLKHTTRVYDMSVLMLILVEVGGGPKVTRTDGGTNLPDVHTPQLVNQATGFLALQHMSSVHK